MNANDSARDELTVSGSIAQLENTNAITSFIAARDRRDKVSLIKPTKPVRRQDLKTTLTVASWRCDWRSARLLDPFEMTTALVHVKVSVAFLTVSIV